MILFRHKKTGKLYSMLAAGVDCTNARDGLAVIVYSPEDNPHLICVREREEFYEKFEETNLGGEI